MKKLISVIICALCLCNNYVEAGVKMKLKEQILIGSNQQKLVIFQDDSVWITAKRVGESNLVNIPIYMGPYDTLCIDEEFLEPGNTYYLIRRYSAGSDYDDEIYPGFLLSLSSDTMEDPEGSVTSHQVIGSFSLPSQFSLDEGVVLLDDGRIWIMPAYQNTFKVGDAVTIFTESDSLVYLIKTVAFGDSTKEIFIPSKKIKKGIYKIY